MSTTYSTPVIYFPASMIGKKDAAYIRNCVTRASNGDNQAMTELYDMFAGDIYRYAMTIVRNDDIAEDIVSETFLRAWTNLPTFKDGNFRAFLYTIARNYAYDVIKKDNRCTSLTEEPQDTSQKNDVLKHAIATEQHEVIMTALAELPTMYREVVVLRFFEDLSSKETADILGRTEIWVRVTQCRALRKLQKLLS